MLARPAAPALSLPARLRAWFRRGYDAELLAMAPARNERGEPLQWDFTPPRNASPLWRLARPYVWQFAVPTAVLAHALGPLVRGGAPPTLPGGAGEWLALAASVALEVTLLALLGMLGGRTRWNRLALDAFRRHRWTATRELDATIAGALEDARTPARLLPRDAPPARHQLPPTPPGFPR